jgi:Zn-dependent alcohol dehydrogenase
MPVFADIDNAGTRTWWCWDGCRYGIFDRYPLNSYLLTWNLKAAKIRGATTIIGVDKVKSRLDLARDLGATHVIDTSNFASLAADLTKAIQDIAPKGTIANFDTTGVIPIIDAGVQSLGTKGQLILIGIVYGEMSVDIGKMLTVGFQKKVAQRSC